MSDFKRPENGFTGEKRSISLLCEDFWILERSVDVHAVDLIVQEKLNSENELIGKRKETPLLGYIQSKFFEKNNLVRIRRSYVDDPADSYRKGFFAFIHTNDSDDEPENYFFNAKEIQEEWYPDENGENYCFRITKCRKYSNFKNIKRKDRKKKITDGIYDLKNSTESLICSKFISFNSNTRNLTERCGEYILSRIHGCPVAIYRSSQGYTEPLDPRKDNFPYAGWFEWGYSGEAPKFLAISMLTHFFGGKMPPREAVNTLLAYLISRLSREDNIEHIISEEMILKALAYIPYNAISIEDPLLQNLYQSGLSKYEPFLKEKSA